MKEPDIYNLRQASEVIGEDPVLIGFLLADRQIPFRKFGPMKMVDAEGLKQLAAAAEDYRRKAGPVVPRPTRRRPRRAAASH